MTEVIIIKVQHIRPFHYYYYFFIYIVCKKFFFLKQLTLCCVVYYVFRLRGKSGDKKINENQLSKVFPGLEKKKRMSLTRRTYFIFLYFLSENNSRGRKEISFAELFAFVSRSFFFFFLFCFFPLMERLINFLFLFCFRYENADKAKTKA